MGGRLRKKRERENERANFLINEGKGISTILFFIQPSGKNEKQTNEQTNKNNNNKTIENKIIINSKTHINRDRETVTERQIY